MDMLLLALLGLLVAAGQYRLMLWGIKTSMPLPYWMLLCVVFGGTLGSSTYLLMESLSRLQAWGSAGWLLMLVATFLGCCGFLVRIKK